MTFWYLSTHSELLRRMSILAMVRNENAIKATTTRCTEDADMFVMALPSVPRTAMVLLSPLCYSSITDSS
jgi:hypothetical protein